MITTIASPRNRSVLLFLATLLILGGLAAAAAATSHSAARPAMPALVTDTDGAHQAGGPAGDYVEHGAQPTQRQMSAARATGFVADVRAVRSQGYTVHVPTSATALYRTTVAVAGQLRTLGVHMTVVRSNSTAVSTGTIRVFPKTDCSGTLLGLTSRTQGGVWNAGINNWTITALYAQVGICTRTVSLGGSWLTATVQHELGHALGLGHFTSTYAGRYQIMKPVLSAGMVGYREGDRAGLRALVAGAPRA